MARKKPKLASKKSEKSKHNKGPTTNLDFEVGELEGNVDVGLGSVGAEIELETGGLAEGTSMDIIIELDVSPIEFDLDYDPTSSELSGSIEIGLPGDLIGVTGGLTVNTETGEVTAITGGVALAGLELEITTGVGKYACRTVSTVTFFGIGYSVTQDNCKDDDETVTGGGNNDSTWEQTIEFDLTPGQKFAVIRRFSILGSSSSTILPRVCFDGASLTFALTVYAEEHGGTIKSENYEQEDLESYLRWITVEPPFTRYKLEMYTDSAGDTAHILWKGIGTFFVEQARGEVSLQSDNSLWSAAVSGPTWVSAKAIPLQVFVDDGSIYPPLAEPEPEPTPPPLSRPRPHRRRRENPMNEDCCRAILEMLTGVANVTGVSETYSYPLPVKVKDEVVESYNLIHYHALKPGVDDVLKVIGSVPEDAEVFPIEIYVQQNPTDRRPTKIEVNNISQLLFLVGNSTGYNDVNKPVELRLNKDNRVFTYRSLGDAIRELMPVLAPHKMVYANKDNGYAIPFEQLTPQGEGYDTTKDYLGIYTRLFSSVQRYGFDSPVYIKLKDKDPNIEGDEEAGYTVLNLAGAIEKLLYYQKEIGEDIDTQTNLLIRLSFLLTRTYSMVIKSWYRITAILDGLNISVKQIAVNAVVEFNLLAGKIFKPGQGFENKDNNDNSEPPELELDLTDEDTTNNLLDKLLDNSELDLSVDKLKKKNGKQK